VSKKDFKFMKIALVVTDDLTVLLFCKRIIKCLQTIPNAQIIVVCNASQFRPAIEKLGVDVIHLYTSRTISPWRDFVYILKLLFILRYRQIDVVFNIIAAKQNIYGSIAARLGNVGCIFSWVNGLGQAFNDSANQRRLRGLVSFLYKLAFKFNSKVWFNNPADRDLFLSAKLIEDSKTYLSRFFLDIDEYCSDRVSKQKIDYATQKLRLQPTERVVLMVARMLWEKGMKEFCDSAKQVSNRDSNIRFVLIAPLEPNHINSVPESFITSIPDKCNFTWIKFEEDVRPFYFLSDLAVLPSYYKEGGYPRALLEPMAMGKPIITTDTDGCRGTVEDGLNGFLIPPRDAGALAMSIARIMGDDDLRKRMGQYSRLKALRDFDEKQIVPDALRSLGLPIPSSA